MKKSVLWLLISLVLGCWSIFAQQIFPDEATIEVKNPIIEWEAVNLKITMMRNWSPMTSYTWTIIAMITEENGSLLNQWEYTLPNRGMYTFLAWDLWSKEFQKWLEIKKEWNFYIEISDLNDTEDRTLWKQLVQVIKNGGWIWNVHIDVLNPTSNWIITNEKVEILAQAESLPNSTVLVYVDDKISTQTTTDSNWLINHSIQNIDQWIHSLKLEISDIEWNILWTSDTIFFTYTPQETQRFKDIKVEPENWLMEKQSVDITVYTDDVVESVKLRLSDGSDGIFLNKIWNGEFSTKMFLNKPGTIELSLDMTSLNSTLSKSYENIKQISVTEIPWISNVKTNIDDQNQTVEISWDPSDVISLYSIDYRLDNFVITWQAETNTNSFVFNDVPYDTPVYLTITPRVDELNDHGTASQTIQFIIRKPEESESGNTAWSWSIPNIPNTGDENIITSKCTIQNIATHTEQIWNSHYLIWDKVENVSKYVVYSSESPLWIDKIKVYETTDTSYEYPFDYTSEEDQFMYFRIVWICDDGEEVELSWATKVQVWPVQDFFLLVCMTLLIYFGIRLFRQTEE